MCRGGAAGGRLRFLKNRIAFSTLTVTLRETARSQPLVAFAQGLWSFTIWIVVWAPVWLSLAWIARYAERRRRRVQPSPPAPSP